MLTLRPRAARPVSHSRRGRAGNALSQDHSWVANRQGGRPPLCIALPAMKELPATLPLSPIGWDTLAVKVWTEANNAAYGEAIAPALILVTAAAVPMLLLAARDRIRELAP
jgi:hypothetical protein